MKKYVLLILAVFGLLFTASCIKKDDDFEKNPPAVDDETKDDDEFEHEEEDGNEQEDEEDEEEDMELKGLPYYSYLKKTNPRVTIEVKDFGALVIELFPDVAENTVNNFLDYSDSGAYVGMIFHRIIEHFMIQGGAVNKPNRPIKGEFNSNGVVNNLYHHRGVISMARTNVRNSATSQFFIVHGDSPHLNGEYAGFGGLVKGFDILDAIAAVSVDFYDQPYINIVIEKVTVSLNGYTPKKVVYS